jgi:hypothetical protein
LVLLSSCIFFADVFIRRVSVDFTWVSPWLAGWKNRIMGRELEPHVDERIARLRNRKREIEGRIDERRAAARFEPEPDAEISTDVLDSEAAGAEPIKQKHDRGKPEMTPAEAEEETYTSRLLKAKKDARKQSDQDK